MTVRVSPIGPKEVAARLARSLQAALEELHTYRPYSMECEDKFETGMMAIALKWSPDAPRKEP